MLVDVSCYSVDKTTDVITNPCFTRQDTDCRLNYFQHLLFTHTFLFCINIIITSFLSACANYFLLHILESFQELSLKNGDLVYLDSRVDPNWLRGHLENGTSGIFPRDVVEIVVSGWGRWSRWVGQDGARVW